MDTFKMLTMLSMLCMRGTFSRSMVTLSKGA